MKRNSFNSVNAFNMDAYGSPPTNNNYMYPSGNAAPYTVPSSGGMGYVPPTNYPMGIARFGASTESRPFTAPLEMPTDWGAYSGQMDSSKYTGYQTGQDMAMAPPNTSFFSEPGKWLKDNGYLTQKDQNGMTTTGFLDYGLGAAQGVANLWMGMKQYGMAKDSLNFQKDSYAKNFAAQKGLTNAELSDRQIRRRAENPNAMPVEEYMSKYGIK